MYLISNNSIFSILGVFCTFLCTFCYHLSVENAQLLGRLAALERTQVQQLSFFKEQSLANLEAINVLQYKLSLAEKNNTLFYIFVGGIAITVLIVVVSMAYHNNSTLEAFKDILEPSQSSVDLKDVSIENINALLETNQKIQVSLERIEALLKTQKFQLRDYFDMITENTNTLDDILNYVTCPGLDPASGVSPQQLDEVASALSEVSSVISAISQLNPPV